MQNVLKNKTKLNGVQILALGFLVAIIIGAIILTNLPSIFFIDI